MARTIGTIAGRVTGRVGGTTSNATWWRGLEVRGVLPSLAAQFNEPEGGRYMVDGIEKTFAETFGTTRASVANAANGAGVEIEHAINVGRIAHQGGAPLLERTGLILEAQKSTVNPVSRDFSQWTTNTTASYTSVVSLDGSMRNVQLTDADNVDRLWREASYSSAIVDSTAYTMSCFIPVSDVAPGHFPAVGLTFSGGTTLRGGLVLNTQTGAVVFKAGKEDNDSITAIREGAYWRVVIVMTNNATGNTNVSLTLNPAWNTTAGSAGQDSTTGSTIFDAVQVEASLFAGSVIHLDGTTVTRMKDIVIAVPDGDLPHAGFVDDAVTFVIEFRVKNYAGGNQQVMSYSVGTNDRVDIYTSGSGTYFIYVQTGAAQANDVIAVAPINEWIRLVIQWNATHLRTALNGNVVVDKAITGPAKPNKFEFGRHPAGFNETRGIDIREFISWPSYVDVEALKEISL